MEHNPFSQIRFSVIGTLIFEETDEKTVFISKKAFKETLAKFDIRVQDSTNTATTHVILGDLTREDTSKTTGVQFRGSKAHAFVEAQREKRGLLDHEGAYAAALTVDDVNAGVSAPPSSAPPSSSSSSSSTSSSNVAAESTPKKRKGEADEPTKAKKQKKDRAFKGPPMEIIAFPRLDTYVHTLLDKCKSKIEESIPGLPSVLTNLVLEYSTKVSGAAVKQALVAATTTAMFKQDESKKASFGVKYVPPGRARNKGVLSSKINDENDHEMVEALCRQFLRER